MSGKWRKYILWFAQEHVNFRKAEIDSIVKLFDLQMRKVCEESLKPFWIVEFPNEETALKLASRSILLRCVLELWSHNSILSRFHQDVERYIEDNGEDVEPFFLPECTFKITVETYNKHISHTEKVAKIESFDYLPVEGNVDLEKPHVEWWYIEFYGLDPTAASEDPEDVLLGRLIANGQRGLIKELSLKNRKFIGNTSMDAQLSVLMANQALVNEADLVFDPFVGTGSLLVSAAKFGGFVLGSDIDYMMLHGRSRPSRITQKVRAKDESIRANLKQYGCEDRYLDVIVSDFSNPTWRSDLKFDCIITDPPYGIREATEKIETKSNAKTNTRSDDMPHYPSTSHYALPSLYMDLLTFAVKHLKLGGRLVCWWPFHIDDYTDEMIPQHEKLRLIANSNQPLSGLTSRRLLTYEKHSEFEDNQNTVCTSKEENQITDFRERYFDGRMESRAERRARRAELRKIGQLEALKRGKQLDENGKIIKKQIK